MGEQDTHYWRKCAYAAIYVKIPISVARQQTANAMHNWDTAGLSYQYSGTFGKPNTGQELREPTPRGRCVGKVSPRHPTWHLLPEGREAEGSC